MKTILLSAALVAAVLARAGVVHQDTATAPNFVVILADDLGYGDVGPFGQRRIRTPRIDRIAAEGMRFTQFYSGSTVCAPSRGTLLTGRHTGHAYVRDNHELGGFLDEEERGQLALPPDHPTVARWLKARGYATAVVGKWGLGGPGSTGVPTKQGFDFFFGYLDQKQAHNYYPTHLWRNEERYPLRNKYFSPHQPLVGDPKDAASYEKYRGTDYAIDFMTREAVSWLRANASKPFFLYFAPTIPHVSLQVPEEALKQYEGAFPETPYTGNNRYLPHRTPRAAYAAMITYLDAQVGRILDTLKAIGADERTTMARRSMSAEPLPSSSRATGNSAATRPTSTKAASACR
jgi:arylsulfatase A-like enzyme